jgi:uncharacterized YccA/Bax inhibitor family protein
MRSSNPVLSKTDWNAQPAQVQGQFAPGQPGQYGQDPYTPYQPQQQAPGAVMTIDDAITKSAIVMGVLVASAALSFTFLPDAILMPAAIIAALVAFGTVLLVSFRRAVNPAFVLAYAAIEGVFIGGISKIYENAWGGIVQTAVLATFVTAGVTLAAYKFFRIKVTNKFRKMVMIGTMAYAGVLLGILLLISALGVGLAVFNLILDFDYIEQGVAAGAPASESWRAAFGLTVTMVWLYIEMLRLLSYFRSN